MTAASTRPVSFAFASNAIAPDTFEVIAFRGEEEISSPYRFEIDLVAEDPDIDMEAILHHPASLTIEKGDDVRNVHGVVTQCRLSDALPDHRFRYAVVLRPRIWLLSMNRQNQIYQELSVPDIIVEELKSSTATGSTQSAAAGLTSDDFELRLTRDYPQREYVVQYEESDLAFISRLMEHEGIFYFFEQGEGREKLVISDNNIHFGVRDNADPIPYQPESALARSEDEAIRSLSAATRRIPQKLILKDYNYRMPHVMLQAEADIDATSHGLVSQYGDHFKTPEEGTIMARIRSQEIACTKQTFEGESDSIALEPGWLFKLEDHFREAFNADHVVTRIGHHGRQPVSGVAGLDASGNEAAEYGNSFACIPSGVDYRPPRRTPKPVVPGLMNAHVDAALLENRAEIDGQGRYKLIMPFDLSGAAAGKASRYVRKAQPYGGKDMGMHFPLYKGTEVICTFINGDPDRPIITGVVPNPLTASVVTDGNYTKNVVKTGHGSYFEFNDGKGPVDKGLDAAAGQGNLAAQQQQQSIDARPPNTVRSGAGASGKDLGTGPFTLKSQQQAQALDTAQESDASGTDDIWFRVDVPDYDTATSASDPKASYLRMGTIPEDERYAHDSGSKEESKTCAVADSDQGITIDCTEGYRYTVTPDPAAGIHNPVYSKGPDTMGVNFDASTGTMTFDIGFNQAGGTYSTAIKIAYVDDNGAPAEATTTITWNIQEGGEPIPDGWFDFTDGDHTTVAMGNRKDVTHGSYKQKIFTKDKKPFFYDATFDDMGVQRKVTLGQVFSFSTQFGTKESYFGGFKFDGFIGGSSSVSIASTMKAAMGFNISANLDANVKLGNSWNLELANGNKAVVSKSSSLYGESIKLRIMDAKAIKSSHAIWQAVLGVGAGVMAGAEIVSSVLSGVEMEVDSNDPYGTNQGNDLSSAGSILSWSTLGLAEIAKFVAFILAIVDYKRIQKQWATVDSNMGNPRFQMTKDEIYMRCGDAGILIKDGKVNIFGDKMVIAPSPSNQDTVIVDSKGLAVEIGDLNVKAGKMTSSGDIETKSGRLKSKTLTTDPAPAPKIPKMGKKNLAIVKKLKKTLPNIK